MAAARVETAYINGTGAASIPGTVARSEAFYEKLLQLHKDVVAGKNPRLTFAQTSRVTKSNEVPQHLETGQVAYLRKQQDQRCSCQYRRSALLE